MRSYSDAEIKKIARKKMLRSKLKKKEIPDSVVVDAARRFHAGETLKDIASEYGVSYYGLQQRVMFYRQVRFAGRVPIGGGFKP